MISDERVIGYAKWNESEARSLRLHCANSPSMPELAEMHEETADALRSLLRERNELAILCDDLRKLLQLNPEQEASAVVGRRIAEDRS